jgi:L-glyceraldehyde 3-phosphate reductase
MGALESAVTQGKALYVGISSYSSARTVDAARLLQERDIPLLIHQPSYSMFNRWLEHDRLLDALETVGAGCIAFSPLAQGLLTDRYLHGIPDDSRVATGGAMSRAMITEERLANVRALAAIASARTEPRSARVGVGPSRPLGWRRLSSVRAASRSERQPRRSR